MPDALRLGALGGALAALLLGSMELLLAAPAVLSSGAELHGMVLVPLFYASLLLPACIGCGWVLGGLGYCVHGKDGEAQRSAVRASRAAMGDGSLAWPGVILGSALTLGGVLALGVGLHIALLQSFHNQLLKALLSTLLLLALAGLWFSLVRGLLRVLSMFVARLRERAGDGRPTSRSLLIVLGVMMAVVLGSGLWLSRGTLIDIGPERLLWVVSCPLLLLLSIALATGLSQRWGRLELGGWSLAALVLLGLPLSVALGELRAVRLAGLMAETPTAILVSAIQHATDFDGDGAPSLFGGPDCAPFDSAVGPLSREIPGNGIDDNCVAGDAPKGRDDGIPPNERAYAVLPKDFPRRPDLVLITIDALRADHMGLHGYRHDTTPRIDKHAQDAVVFDSAYSQGTGTISSMPSMMTSKYAYQLLFEDGRMPPRLSSKETTIAEYLQVAGYATSGISTIRYTREPRWNLLQGFDRMDLSLTLPDPAFRLTSPRVLELALAELKRLASDKAPYFLWVHFFDVHSDYLPHDGQPSFGKGRMAAYDGEVRYTDTYVGELLDSLRADARPKVIVLAADHGDGFRSDRGKRNHAYGLFNELLRTPLIVWAPDATPRRASAPVGNVDIGATLLTAAGVKEPSLMGHSLVPQLYDGVEDPERIVFSAKTFGGVGKPAARYRKSAVGERFKMIRWITEDKEFLFDLKADPGEKRNVVAKFPGVAAQYRTHIDGLLERITIDRAVLEDREAAKSDRGESRKGWTLARKVVEHHIGAVGGRGRPRSFECPSKHTLGGLVLVPGDDKGGLGAVHPICYPGEGEHSGVEGPWWGQRQQASEQLVRCRGGEDPIGMFGHADRTLTSLGLICRIAASEETYRTRQVGVVRGKPVEAQCPAGQVMVGYSGHVRGNTIQGAGFVCAAR